MMHARHTSIGINMPITSPPDDAIISFWQPDLFISHSQMRRLSSRCPSRRIQQIQRMNLNNLTHSSHLINRTIPCLSTCQSPDPPHQPDQNDPPDHPMPPAPRGVSPDSPVHPPLPPHDKPGGGDSALKRQKQSISSADFSLPSQSQSSPTVVVTCSSNES